VHYRAARLFTQYHQAVYGYLRRMARNRDVAEDLTQEVFLKVLVALPAYEERERERS
jgi:RNA polymerase sigma-70 factor (ECF subfamily)